MLAIADRIGECLLMHPFRYCKRIGFTRCDRVALVALVFVISLGNASFAQTPASQLSSGVLSSLLTTYVKNCRAGTGDKDSSFAIYFCSCASAFTMDRFSLDQLSDASNNSPEKLDKISPGYMDLVKTCATAASHRND